MCSKIDTILKTAREKDRMGFGISGKYPEYKRWATQLIGKGFFGFYPSERAHHLVRWSGFCGKFQGLCLRSTQQNESRRV